MASAFLCGPTVFRRTEHVCHTRSIAAQGRGVHTQPCRFTQGENVVNILLASYIYIYSVHTWTEKAQGRGGEGAAHPAQLTPKCHEGGGALFPWKPSLSNI